MTTIARHEAPIEQYDPLEAVNYDLIIIAHDRVAYHGSYTSPAKRLERTAEVLRTVDIFAVVSHITVNQILHENLGKEPDAVFNILAKFSRLSGIHLYAATSPKPTKIICAPEPVLYSVATTTNLDRGPEVTLQHFTSDRARLQHLREEAAKLCPHEHFDATIGAMNAEHLALMLSMLLAPVQITLTEAQWSPTAGSYGPRL